MERLSLEKFESKRIDKNRLSKVYAGGDPVGTCTGGGANLAWLNDGSGGYVLCYETTWESDVEWNDGSMTYNGLKGKSHNVCAG